MKHPLAPKRTTTAQKKAILRTLKTKLREITKLERKLERTEPRPLETAKLIEEIQVPSLEILKDKKKTI